MHGIDLDLLRPTTHAWMKQVEYLPQALLDNPLVKLHSLLPDTGIADCCTAGMSTTGTSATRPRKCAIRRWLSSGIPTGVPYAVRSPGAVASAGELLLYCHWVLFRYHWVLLLAGRASLSPTNQPGRSSPTSYVTFSVSVGLSPQVVIQRGRCAEGAWSDGGSKLNVRFTTQNHCEEDKREISSRMIWVVC